MMKAMTSDGTGALAMGEVAKPSPSGREILVEVYASGINRIDTYMMKGAFGEVPVLGMEISGRIVELGPECEGPLAVGDDVIALMSDSGQAEFATVDERHAMRKPSVLSFAHAAAVPEQWLTAFQLLHLVGEVQSGDRVLIHAGASGVGTTAIQLCRFAGAIPYVTAGSEKKLEKCKGVGAEGAFNYKDTENPWSEELLKATDGKGVDVVLDCVGGSHAQGNMAVLATDARWVLFGLMGGRSLPSGENFLGNLMRKRASLRSTTLRMRSTEYKAALVSRFAEEVLPNIGLPGSDAPLSVLVDSMFPLDKTADAYDRLQANLNVGKIVIVVKDTTDAAAGGASAAADRGKICGGVQPGEQEPTAEVQVCVAVCLSIIPVATRIKEKKLNAELAC